MASDSVFWVLLEPPAVRFVQAFSLGGGAGTTLSRSWSGFADLDTGDCGSSSLLNTSLSKDFSLSLLTVA